jgi:hypothetical protein
VIHCGKSITRCLDLARSTLLADWLSILPVGVYRE